MDSLERMSVRGLTFFVREQSSDVKAVNEVVTKNSYERKDFKILPDSTWLDLGGNVGAFAVLAASKGARVTCVEPDPDNAKLVRMNVRANGVEHLVDVIEAAVVPDSIAGGHIELHVNGARRNYWRNSIVKKWRGGSTVLVPTIGVSKLPHVECCKMDIEGAEMPILESFSSSKPPWGRLVFEWSFDIDRSIPRFSSVVEALRVHYANVKYSKFDENEPRWRDEWFPPCRTVWCYE